KRCARLDCDHAAAAMLACHHHSARLALQLSDESQSASSAATSPASAGRSVESFERQRRTSVFRAGETCVGAIHDGGVGSSVSTCATNCTLLGASNTSRPVRSQ